ncbi:MAG: hypothetical protein IKZ49_04430 [Alphaproteobacteria bacterium]|nr:hypothetical protein [Alphaproteobacteria bacterium]
MKKSLKSLIAVSAAVMTTGAFASTNMENPLYMPKAHEVYLKTGAAIMYKTVEKTEATAKKGTDGNLEFPVWRFAGDIGYGITDRLDLHGHFGYTKDGEINRKGMHRGRIGLMYRALTEQSPFILDLYADAYLSGVTPMRGTYTSKGFDFANYSNGRWGAIGGARFGKEIDNWTLAAHIEYLQTFGNHNNEIGIEPTITPLATTMANLPSAHPLYPIRDVVGALTMPQLGFPDQIAVDLKSTHETVAGFDVMYQMNSKWSFGGGFEYIEHYDNGVKSIHTKLKNPDEAASILAPYVGGAAQGTATAKQLQEGVKQGLLDETKTMKDGWDEYVLKTSVAYQYNEDIQFAAFFEYTFDDAHANSQNATDCKMELGVRMNARF